MDRPPALTLDLKPGSHSWVFSDHWNQNSGKSARWTTRDSEMANGVPYIPNMAALKPRAGPDFLLLWDY